MLKVLESKIMLENPNTIVVVEVGRSNDTNAMGRERDVENPTTVRRSDTR